MVHHLHQGIIHPPRHFRQTQIVKTPKPLKNTAHLTNQEIPELCDIFLNELDIATVRAENISLLNGNKCPVQETLPCSIRTL